MLTKIINKLLGIVACNLEDEFLQVWKIPQYRNSRQKLLEYLSYK